MNAIVAVLLVSVGAAVTAPQGQARYQQSRPTGIANYPYRNRPPVYITDNVPPVTPQKTYKPPRQPGRPPYFRKDDPSDELTESPVQTAVHQFNPAVPKKPYIVILKQSQEDNFDGSFSYSFDTENGISVQAEGYLKDPGTEVEAQVIHGTYSYIADDGTPIQTSWYADDTGFHAEGAHLPVPPPIPDAIAQIVSYKRSAAQIEEETKENSSSSVEKA